MRVSYTILIVLLFFITGHLCHAQNQDRYNSDVFPKIMLIPYQQDKYFSDVNLSGNFFRRKPRGFITVNDNAYLRQNLDKSLFDNLLTYFNINRISYYETKQAKADLTRIYESVNYPVRNQRLKYYYKNLKNFSVFRMITYGKNPYGMDCISQKKGRQVKRNKRLKYTDVVVTDSSLFEYLDQNYHCDYYLFINEVELYSRYRVCNDLMKNVHQKDIVLHFTLIDNSGERVSGGMVAVTYSPTRGRNSIIDVVDKNMNILSSMVTDVIRQELKLSLMYIPE